MKKIKDSKIALITGACGGIGKALVHKYASQNITLALADKSQDQLDKLVKNIQKNGGTAAVSYTHLTLPTICSV